MNTAVAQTSISPTTWGGTTPNTTTGPSMFAPLPASSSPGTARVNVSQWDRGSGVLWNTASNRYNSKDWYVGAPGVAAVFANNDYIYFTVTNNSTTQLKITGVGVGSGQASGTGPNTFGLMYRIGSGSALIFSASVSGPSPSFSLPTGVVLCAGETITFYLCGWGGSSAAGTWSINSGASITAQWIDAVATTASNTSPVAAGTPFTLNSSPSLGVTPYSYSWAGPSYTSTTASPTVPSPTPAASGIYTLTVTDAWGCKATATTTVTVNASSSCSGTPTAGTTIATPSSICGSGSSSLSLSGSSSSSGITYQWLSATTPGGPYTIIGSATLPNYTTPVIAATTYYRCVVTCTAASSSDTSSEATVTVNALPTISAPGGDVCSGGTGRTITASGAATYTWAPATGLSATTGATVTANPSATTIYTITGTSAVGCVNTTTTTVNYVLTPGALTVAPVTVNACAGDAVRVLRASGGIVGPTAATVNSGSITIPSSIGSSGSITADLIMAGIPSTAVITGASVNIINFGSQYQNDYVFNIKAPNGNVLNLINQVGTHVGAVGTLFANTNLSSASATALSGGSGTYTGTWAADAATAVGAAPNISNVTAWSNLYSIPNGTWTLSIFNNTSFANVVVPSMQWSITLNYTYPSSITWSPATNLYNDAAATIPYAGGVVDSVFFNPVTAGTVGYVAIATNGTCTRTATINTTVNALPTITGADTVCVGQTVTLSGSPATGTWSSASANVSISSADITGLTAGTAEVTYTLPTGCLSTFVMTVNALPAPITGTFAVCEGADVILANSTLGGVWSSSNTNAIAAAGGVITGNTAGTATISYTLTTGCSTTQDVVIHPAPSSIGGPSAVCIGSSITLSNSVSGGSWSSNNTNVTVDAALGTVTGATAGTSVISYIMTTGGCYVTKTITINALPATISGPSRVCENGGVIDLDDATLGGSWSRSNTNLNIDAVSGIVTGVAAGNTIVTYTAGTGCYTTTIITIDAVPDIITGTMQMCEGSSVTLFNATGTGTWSTTSTDIAVVAATGNVSGIHAATAVVSYIVPMGCYAVATVTVNQTPSAITGLAAVCRNASISLASTPSGGTWSADNANVTVGASTGVITGASTGTSVVTYTIGAGCYATRTISVNQLPDVISGASEVCASSSINLTNTSSGGTWISGSTAIASIDNATGLLTGAAAGTADITYKFVGTGCFVSSVVTVNEVPATPVGSLSICYGAAVSFTTTATGGTWSTSNASVASIDASGDVYGVAFGTARISYTLPVTGCSSYASVTVTATPSAITGSLQTCIGFTSPLSNPVAGGTWSTSNPAIGTINTTTGVFTGIATGTASVTYGLLSGCSISTTVTVNNLPPAITGPAEFCYGTSIMLLNTAIGGSWSTGAAGVAVVGSSTGIVTGVAAGTATISYTTGIGCTVVKNITVNPLPAPITGPYTVCEGGSVSLSNALSGGTWNSGDASVATIDASTGVVTGTGHGTAYITYTLPSTCAAHAAITVNAAPFAITGGSNICLGASSALASATPGGTWSTSSVSIVSLSGFGVAFGNAIGTSIISYTLANGCYTTNVATVNPIPFAYSITGGGNYCSGASGTNIGLSSSQLGVDYTLYTGPVNVATTMGTGTAIGFGLITTPGVYTIQATDAVTGCHRNMTGSTFVAIQPLVTPIVSIAATSFVDTSCSGAPVTFTANPINGGTLPVYTWLVNGAVSGSGITYTYVPAGGDIVELKMASNISCRTIDTAVAVSNRVVLPSLAPAVGISVSPNDTVCELTPVTFVASPINGGSAPSYVWMRNGVVDGMGDTYTYTPAHLDAVKCIITSNYMCRTADTTHSATTVLSVLSPVLPTVGLSVAPGTTIAAGQTCTLTATASNAGTSPTYQWLINNVPVAGATSSVFVSNTFSNGDIVTCVVASSGICSGVTNFNSTIITVLAPGGVSQIETASVRLLPNPNNGSFAITGIPAAWASEDVTLIITNTLGQKVYERTQRPSGNTLQAGIDGALPDGMYLATLKTGTGRMSVNFIVKR